MDDRDACSTEAYILVVEVRYAAHPAEVAAYGLAKRPRARAVQDTYLPDPELQGLVDVVAYGIQRLTSSEAAHIQLVAEVQALLMDLIDDAGGLWLYGLLMLLALEAPCLTLGSEL